MLYLILERDDYMELGKRIQELCVPKGLTQKQVRYKHYLGYYTIFVGGALVYGTE